MIWRLFAGRTTKARLSSEDVGRASLGVPDANLMVSSGAAHFRATSDIEEGSSE